MHRQITREGKPALGLTYASNGAPAQGTAIDRRGFEWALVLLTIGALAGNVTVTVQHGDESDGSDAVDIPGATFTLVDTVADNTLVWGEIHAASFKRYLRIAHNSGAANVFGATFLLHKAYNDDSAQEPVFVVV